MPEARIAVVPVRMKPSALTVVDALAAKDGRSRSDIIRRALAAGLPIVKAQIEKG